MQILLRALRALTHPTFGPLDPGQPPYQTRPGQLFYATPEEAEDFTARGLAEYVVAPKLPPVEAKPAEAKMKPPHENKMHKVPAKKWA